MRSSDLIRDDTIPQSAPDPLVAATPKWFLNQQAFDKLLNLFSSDREEAGVQYEVMRRKLVRFFEWREIGLADEYADETINRVARRIDEGETIENLRGYFYGVARMVFKEALRKKERATIELDKAAQIIVPEDSGTDPRVKCFDRCLESLAPESRQLILEYYQDERRAKIQLRQQIADRLRIPLNALRIRAHRIRVSLERCITACLQAPSKSK